MVRKQRKIGELPPLYPNGWYEVMRSEELPVGTVKAVFMIGKHFAVFRRENGQVGMDGVHSCRIVSTYTVEPL